MGDLSGIISSHTDSVITHTGLMRSTIESSVADAVTLEQGSSLVASIRSVTDFEDNQALLYELIQVFVETTDTITNIATIFEECDALLFSNLEAQSSIPVPVPTPTPTPGD